MYLVNALAFDAEWTKKYNELGVIDGIFTTEDSKRELPPLSKWNAEV